MIRNILYNANKKKYCSLLNYDVFNYTQNKSKYDCENELWIKKPTNSGSKETINDLSGKNNKNKKEEKH